MIIEVKDIINTDDINNIISIVIDRFPLDARSYWENFPLTHLKYIEPTYYLAYENDTLLGFAIVRTRAEKRWMVLATKDDINSVNLGKVLVAEVLKTNETLNGWVYNGDNRFNTSGGKYKDPLNYYKSIGCKVLRDTSNSEGDKNVSHITLNKNDFK